LNRGQFVYAMTLQALDELKINPVRLASELLALAKDNIRLENIAKDARGENSQQVDFHKELT